MYVNIKRKIKKKTGITQNAEHRPLTNYQVIKYWLSSYNFSLAFDKDLFINKQTKENKKCAVLFNENEILF